MPAPYVIHLARDPCDLLTTPEYNCRVSTIVTQAAELTAHPSTPSDAVRSLEAQLRAEESGIVMVEFSLAADMSRLCVPPSGTGGRADDLWKHTCFEAFVAPVDAPGYYEFNFSPALDWAIYRFSAYRQAMPLAEVDQAPEISVRRSDDGLQLKSAVRLGHLAGLRDARSLRIALTAVIEENNGRLSYWALRHAPGKPDFHHSLGFTLQVARP